MKTTIHLTVAASLISASGISHASLAVSSGPENFSGSVSVTATATNVASASNSNNGATAASVSLGQFDAATGVLTGVDLTLSSSRTQTIQGNASKGMGSSQTANGSGTSIAALTIAGFSGTFTPAITQNGSGCSLSMGMGGSCSWGPITSAATATHGGGSVAVADLDSYVGNGSVSASLTLPSLSATSTLSSTSGMGGGGMGGGGMGGGGMGGMGGGGMGSMDTSTSTTTYTVNWSGSLEATYTYLLHAAPSFDGDSSQNVLSLDFGTVAQGSDAALGFSLYNLANADRVGLDLDSVTGSGDTAQLSTNLAAFSGLGQGGSVGLLASLDTSTAGLFSAQYILGLSDADVGAASTRGNYQLTLNLSGNVAPVPVPAAIWLFGPALAGMGLLGRRGRATSPEAA